MFNVATRKFIGENGHVKKIVAGRVEWKRGDNGQYKMIELPGTEFELDADLVVLAMGFEHPIHEEVINPLGVKVNNRGNIAVDEHRMTNIEGVFAAGDAKRGASLVVWAIQEGKEVAAHINDYLSRIEGTKTPISELAAR
jgi:glutamate synthase (NADPH/NADH) small chain